MKKILAFLLVAVMIFCLSACGNPYKDITDKQIEEYVESGRLGDIHCYYSNFNADRTDDEILVHFPADVYNEETDVFYDKDGDTCVQFFGEKKFYDSETGEEIPEDKIEIGQLVSAFKRTKWDVMLPHFFFHVLPRSEYAFAPYVFDRIENAV